MFDCVSVLSLDDFVCVIELVVLLALVVAIDCHAVLLHLYQVSRVVGGLGVLLACGSVLWGAFAPLPAGHCKSRRLFACVVESVPLVDPFVDSPLKAAGILASVLGHTSTGDSVLVFVPSMSPFLVPFPPLCCP